MDQGRGFSQKSCVGTGAPEGPGACSCQSIPTTQSTDSSGGYERTKLTGDMLKAPWFMAVRVAEGAGYLELCLEGVLCPVLCQSQ